MDTCIFKGAKFDDKFRTRNGRMAIYCESKYGIYQLYIENVGLKAFRPNGKFMVKDFAHDYDIIGEWQEPVNEVCIINFGGFPVRCTSKTYNKVIHNKDLYNQLLAGFSKIKDINY